MFVIYFYVSYHIYGNDVSIKFSVIHKSNDFVDEIVRFVYNIIKKRYFLYRAITIYSSREGMMICLLLQLN